MPHFFNQQIVEASKPPEWCEVKTKFFWHKDCNNSTCRAFLRSRLGIDMLRLVQLGWIFSLIVTAIFIHDSKVFATQPFHAQKILKGLEKDPYLGHRASGLAVWSGKLLLSGPIVFCLAFHTARHLKSLGGLTHYAFNSNSPHPFLDFGGQSLVFIGGIATGYMTNAYMKGGFYISNFDRGYNINPKWFDDTRKFGFKRPPWAVRVVASTSAAYGFIQLAPEALKTCAKVIGMVVNTMF